MPLGRTANAIKIKTDGTTRAVNCACCTPPCPEITDYYITISEGMFNALKAGGSLSASGGGSESTGCSFSATESGTLAGGNCGGSAGVSSETCTGFQSIMTFAWGISKVGLEYRLSYGQGGITGQPSGSCFSAIYAPYNTPCYTVGFFTSWEADTNGGQGEFGFLTNVGTTTLTTSAGSLTFGIWNLDPSASAYLNINIT